MSHTTIFPELLGFFPRAVHRRPIQIRARAAKCMSMTDFDSDMRKMKKKKRKLRGLSLSKSKPKENDHHHCDNNSTPVNTEVVSCPLCGKDLSSFDPSTREEHANKCVDDCGKKNDRPVTEASSMTPASSAIEAETHEKKKCKICDKAMDENILLQIRHIKQCGKAHGILPRDLMPAVTEEYSANREAIRPFNSFDVLMSSSRAKVKAATATTKFRRNYNGWCPEYKRIVQTQPPIIVDGFQYACKQLSSIYVLTHFHSDHYMGLTRHFQAGQIVCSEITAKLVQLKLGVDRKYLLPVPLNQPFQLSDRVEITLLDANHCPGAVLVLFKLRRIGKVILHTGDFRFDHATMQPRLMPYSIHTVYLDTTYCDPKYTFPPQPQVIRSVLNKIEETIHSNKVLYWFGTYSIGKEKVFMEAARHFNKKVYLERGKRQMMDCYRWDRTQTKHWTSESSAADFHVVPMGSINFDCMEATLKQRHLRYRKLVAFRPTGWSFSSKTMLTKRSNSTGTLQIYGVPYSEHSSFDELCDFVKTVNPDTVIPTVNCATKEKASAQVRVLYEAIKRRKISDFFAPRSNSH